MICDSANSLHYHRFFFSMLRRLPEPPLFPSPPSFGPLPPMSNPFFRPWSAATRQPNAVDRTVHQRGSQLLAPPSNGLFILVRQAFDCYDLFPLLLDCFPLLHDCEGEAGVDSPPVNQAGACPTLAA